VSIWFAGAVFVGDCRLVRILCFVRLFCVGAYVSCCYFLWFVRNIVVLGVRGC